MVNRFSVTNNVFYWDSCIKVHELVLLMVILFKKGLHPRSKIPPPQLCVEIRSALCIKTHTHLLYHIRLQSTGILADIVRA